MAACFYLYAALRRVRFASEFLAAALAALSLVAPWTLKFGLRDVPLPWPLLGAAVLQLRLPCHLCLTSWNNVIGSILLAAAIATAVPLPTTPIDDLRLGLFVQLVVLALLFLGAVYADQNGKMAPPSAPVAWLSCYSS